MLRTIEKRINWTFSNNDLTVSRNGCLALNRVGSTSASSFNENFYQLFFQNSFVVSSDFQNNDIEERINNLPIPFDYPHISSLCSEKAKRVGYQIASDYRLKPSRISASVEGGIALVYQKAKKKAFKSHLYELFIEVYNDNSMCAVNLIDNKATCFSEVDDESIDSFVDKFIKTSST